MGGFLTLGAALRVDKGNFEYLTHLLRCKFRATNVSQTAQTVRGINARLDPRDIFSMQSPISEGFCS
jgi:hypothetical protein